MMDYNSAVAFYHSLERFGIRPGLERIGALCEYLGHPEKQMRYVHVAGTNGKGTVCTEISNILRAAGFKTGLYTSPYVLDFRERIQVDNRMIPPEALVSVTEKVKEAVLALNAQGVSPTEFEAITAAAFLYFAQAGCRVAVLETGLGGRYDATNIIEDPIVSVITSVSMDHMNVLGNTLGEIAYEKCGIIKQRCHSVTTASQAPEAARVIRAVAAEKGSFLFEAAPEDLFQVGETSLDGADVTYRDTPIHIPFAGEHQLQNAALSVKACEVIGVNGLDITRKQIKEGIEASFIPARTEIVCRDPLILLDGSHNDGSTAALAALLERFASNKRILAVMGMMRDKDCEKATEHLCPYFAKVIAVTPSNPRAMPAEEFAGIVRRGGTEAQALEDPIRAIDEAFIQLKDYDMLVVCGSLYLASDVRAHLLKTVKDYKYIGGNSHVHFS